MLPVRARRTLQWGRADEGYSPDDLFEWETDLAQLARLSARSRGAQPTSALSGGAAKRLIDIVGSLFLLVLLSPLLALVAVAIWADSGLPIIYRCQRVGLHGRTITILKFRSMHDGSHHHLQELLTDNEERLLQYRQTKKLRDDPRRTRIGGFLRRLSLDELPQLVNVLAGQMSLVGPRPYFRHELAGNVQAESILSVRPGITGLWQVSGRSNLTFEQRLALDEAYVMNHSWKRDTTILLRTLTTVVRGEGAY